MRLIFLIYCYGASIPFRPVDVFFYFPLGTAPAVLTA